MSQFMRQCVARVPRVVATAVPMKLLCRNYVSARTLNPEELNSENVRALVHTLAHVGQWQGDRARYTGLRKNLFDLRRVAVVHNLHVIARLSSGASNQHAFSTP
jgi:hypothetical protein